MDEEYSEGSFGLTKLPDLSARSTSSTPDDSARLPQIIMKTKPSSPEKDIDNDFSPSSRTRRRHRPRSGFSSPSKSARTENRRLISTPLTSLKGINWDNYVIISDEIYQEKKEKLLKHSMLKENLRKYFDVDAKVGIIKTEDSDDDAYDTDLDNDRVGLELIVDEKTKQIKDDGIFPEYKKHCRDLHITPNSFLMRNAMEDHFQMRHRYMNFCDCIAISSEVENNLTFKSVDLQDNGITHKHLQAMTPMLMKNNYLTEFIISCNPLGPESPKLIKRILQSNSHITKADISDCGLGDKGGIHLSEIIENNVFLRELYLRQNRLGNDTARHIGNSLGSNITLEVFDLSWNNIGRHGAVALASGLKANSQLEILNVAMNGFGEEGGIAIFEALRNQDSLIELDISSNRLTDKVARIISTIIPYNRHLRTLKMSFNLISAVGALTLLKPYSSRMKKRLAKVELQGIDVDAELVDAVNTLQTKRGMTVLISRPPSRRERTSDQLTYSLIKIVEVMQEFDFDVYELFPDYETEKEEMVTTDDIIYALKKSDKITDKRKIQITKRAIRETRNRSFQLKELAVIYTQINRGNDPSVEEPLRSLFAGRKRASTPLTVEKKREETINRGVRFF